MFTVMEFIWYFLKKCLYKLPKNPLFTLHPKNSLKPPENA